MLTCIPENYHFLRMSLDSMGSVFVLARGAEGNDSIFKICDGSGEVAADVQAHVMGNVTTIHVDHKDVFYWADCHVSFKMTSGARAKKLSEIGI